MTNADAANIPVHVAVVSDFGRGPFYNTNPGFGKDHFSLTSAMFLSTKAAQASGHYIKGGRQVGGVYYSNDAGNYVAYNVDPVTLANRTQGGVTLNPAHLHVALRNFAGIDQSANAQAFPLTATEAGGDVSLLPLFGG